jgi:O-antigen ligase
MKPWRKYLPYSAAILLGLSFLFADTKITLIGPIVVYPPEVLIYLYFAVIFFSRTGFTKLIRAYHDLSPLVKFSLALYLIGGVIGVFVAPSQHESLGAFKAWIFAPLLLSWIVMTIGEDREKIVYAGLASYGLILSLLAFRQVIGDGLTSRAMAYFNSPNYLAAALMPLAVLFGWHAYKQKSWSFGILTGIIFAAGILTRSLGGLIGVIIALIFSYFYLNKRLKYFLLALGIILVLVSGVILVKRTEGVTNSLNGRIQIWHVGTYFVESWPITGDGLRGFEHDYPNYVGTIIHGNVQEWSAPEPHNLVLALWLSIGLPGLLGFVGLMVVALKWRTMPSAAQLALIAILGHGLVDTPYWRIDLCAIVWVLLAIQLAIKEKNVAAK